MAIFRELEMLALRAAMAVLALALLGCAAPRWVNPERPAADFSVDTATCDREAERVAKRELLTNPREVDNICARCGATPVSREMRAANFAQLAHQRCLASKGWRAAS